MSPERTLETRIARLPTRDLAMLVRWSRLDPDTAQDGPMPRGGGMTAPLSSSQERLWFLEQLGGLGASYHLCVVLDFVERLSEEA
ncbi:MAG: hypothetical protein P8Y48_12790, partial [Novosphingobium sp.]